MRSRTLLKSLTPAIAIVALLSGSIAIAENKPLPFSSSPSTNHHKYYELTDKTKIYQQYGMIDEAKDSAKKTLEFAKKFFEPTHPYLASTLNRLGFINHANGDYPEATDYYHKALDIRVKTFGMMHQDTAKTLSNMGILYHDLEQFDKAEFYYKKAIKAVTLIQGKYNQDNATILENLRSVFETTKNENAKKEIEYHLADIYQVITARYEIDF